MNRSYSKIRHIQESNQRLENRLLNEQYNDEDKLKSRMDSYRNKNEDDELRTRLESYKNKMDGFLDELKSSGSEIDVARFLKQVRNQTDQIYRELDEKSEKALTSFARLQFDLLKHFRHKLKEQ
jgi:hypothetical protein